MVHSLTGSDGPIAKTNRLTCALPPEQGATNQSTNREHCGTNHQSNEIYQTLHHAFGFILSKQIYQQFLTINEMRN